MNAQDFPLTCRICLELRDKYLLVPLSVEIEGDTILSLIESCSSVIIDLKESQLLPQNICHQNICLEKLRTAKEIRKKCIESHELLKNFYQEFQKNPVFIDIVKQEEVCAEEPVITITHYEPEEAKVAPEEAIQEDNNFFDDSFPNDSPSPDSESEPEIFQPISSTLVHRFKKKEVKIIIPRLDPRSYENPEEKSFICDGCGESFPHRTMFMLHFRKVHKRMKAKIHQCQICKQSFQWSNGLKVHQKYHEDQKDFACTLCPRRYVLKNELKKHLITHKCEDLKICGGCGKAFNAHYMKKHSESCKGKASKEEIEKAIADLKIEYDCDLCGMKICGKIFLSKHMKRTHLVEYPEFFECSKCDEVLKSRYDLITHMRHIHRKTKSISCEFCGRPFIKRRMLEIHQKSRACELNHFKCETCQRTFKTKQGFENHQKLCPIDKTVKKIKKRPKEAKQWICEFCGLHLTSQGGHRRHLIARHIDKMTAKLPKKLQCPYYPSCKKIFYYKCDLKNHVDTKHLKLRDFQCELCPKGYAVPSGLRRHMKRIHNKTEEEKQTEKTYACSFCPAKYENDKALSKHLQHHDLTLPDRPLHCLICTRSFKVKKALNAHMRTKHSNLQ